MSAETTTYVGYATDLSERHIASSGGVTSAIIRYMFGRGLIGTALTCRFSVEACRYEPCFIHSAAEYESIGSVYQDVDVVGYIRDNISRIKGAIIVVCAPCQVKGIRLLLDRAGVKSFIIDYFCSGQTVIEGTYWFYKILEIDRRDVSNIRYRGNGWPGGIEITLKNGKVIKRPNYTEPWSTMHASHAFFPKRCHYCKIAESTSADISVGDPWLKEFESDHEGHTLFLVHTAEGRRLVTDMAQQGAIHVEEVPYEYFERSQRPNLIKSRYVDRYKPLIDKRVRRLSDPVYFKKITYDLKSLRSYIRLMLRQERWFRIRRKLYNILHRHE